MNTRSTGRKRPSKHYSVDAFDDIPELKSSDEEPMIDDDTGESEDNFNTEAEPSPSADEEDESDLERGLDEEASNDPSDAGERDLDDNISIAASDFDMTEPIYDIPTGAPSVERISLLDRQVKAGGLDDVTRLYTRGVRDSPKNGVARTQRRLQCFGPSAKDYEPVHNARVRWAYEPALPSRTAESDAGGGFHESYFQTEEMRNKEATEGWSWYYETGGKAAFLKRQVTSRLSKEDVAAYLPEPEDGSRSFTIGQFDDQQLFTLPIEAAMPQKYAWQTVGNATARDYKAGFIVNLGGRVDNLDWAPNQHGQDQYLAATVSTKSEPDDASTEVPTVPYFTPQRLRKSCIQVWHFRAAQDGHIDTEIPPRLQILLCTDWGDVRQLKWCSMLRQRQDERDKEDPGLIAGIWSDGAVRVLDMPNPEYLGTTAYLHIDHAAFESKPPDTVCTSLTWLSSSHLAVGCANGYVALFDLANTLSTPPLPNAKPKKYFSVSTTYILSLTSAYPSRPQILMATSMSGFLTLTDLSHSHPSSPASTLVSQRTRIAQPQLLWHDYSQCALTVDDNYTLRAYPLRRWSTTMSTSKYKSIATALAGSPCHPFVLAGTAGGDVVGVNPMRRVCDSKANLWNQTWFSHEWRRSRVDRPAAGGRAFAAEKPTSEDVIPRVDQPKLSREQAFEAVANEGEAQKDPPNGLSRILEGFRMEHVNLLLNDKAPSKTKDGTTFATVYEEQSAITAVSWNPNMHVAGWAAAGMAVGLVRVEDIAS